MNAPGAQSAAEVRKPAATSQKKRTKKKRTPSPKSFLIKRPSVRVHVYHIRKIIRQTLYEAWRVVYTFNGKRIRKQFALRADAVNYAEDVANRLENGHTLALDETNEQRAQRQFEAAQYRDLAARAQKIGKTPEQILAEDEQRQSDIVTPATTAQLLPGLLALKSKKRERYSKDLRTRLNRFAKYFQCPVHHITQDQLERFLAQFAARNRNNYCNAITQLIKRAKAVGALPEKNRLAPARAHCDGKAIEVFTPGEIAALLRHAPPAFKNYLAIGAFAGVRSEEIIHIQWEHVDLDTALIHVPKEIAKKKKYRKIQIRPNLRAWLLRTPPEKRFGRVCPFSQNVVHRLRKKTARAAGVAWKQNALRDSFISYLLAAGHSEDDVATQAGNSRSDIHNSYLKPLRRVDADLYWKIEPDDHQGELALNIISLRTIADNSRLPIAPYRSPANAAPRQLP